MCETVFNISGTIKKSVAASLITARIAWKLIQGALKVAYAKVPTKLCFILNRSVASKMKGRGEYYRVIAEMEGNSWASFTKK